MNTFNKGEIMQDNVNLAFKNGLELRSGKKHKSYLYMKLRDVKDVNRTEYMIDAEAKKFVLTSVTVFRNDSGYTFSVWYANTDKHRFNTKYVYLRKNKFVLGGNGLKSLGNIFNEAFVGVVPKQFDMFWDMAFVKDEGDDKSKK